MKKHVVFYIHEGASCTLSEREAQPSGIHLKFLVQQNEDRQSKRVVGVELCQGQLRDVAGGADLPDACATREVCGWVRVGGVICPTSREANRDFMEELFVCLYLTYGRWALTC